MQRTATIRHAAHRYNPTCSAPRLQLPEKLSTIVTFFERLTDQLIARLVQSIEKYGSTAFQITELSGTIKQRCRQVRSEPAQEPLWPCNVCSHTVSHICAGTAGLHHRDFGL